jgi:hypothetical protein
VKTSAAVLAIIAVAVAGCSPADTSNSSRAAAANEATPAAVEPAATNAVPAMAAPTSAWSYDDSKDEMRGTTTHFAQIESSNTLNLGFPYEGGSARLIIRKRPSDGLNIMISAHGQFVCSEYSNSAVVHVKFDEAPIQTYGCSEPGAATSDMIFINAEQRFLTNLKKAKKVIIEATFFDHGSEQMSFEVGGLQWPY